LCGGRLVSNAVSGIKLEKGKKLPPSFEGPPLRRGGRQGNRYAPLYGAAGKEGRKTKEFLSNDGGGQRETEAERQGALQRRWVCL
jgi:hypothetical protein